jgi:hypothetical protein
MAEPALSALIRRYYEGDAALWIAIQQAVDVELRRRGVRSGAYHLRLLRRGEGYEISVTPADEWAVPV